MVKGFSHLSNVYIGSSALNAVGGQKGKFFYHLSMICVVFGQVVNKANLLIFLAADENKNRINVNVTNSAKLPDLILQHGNL